MKKKGKTKHTQSQISLSGIFLKHMQVINRVQSVAANTDFATELTELLVALIDCWPPCRQMLRGDVTLHFGRQLQRRTVTFRDLQLQISAQICSQNTQLSKGVCHCRSYTCSYYSETWFLLSIKPMNISLILSLRCPWSSVSPYIHCLVYSQLSSLFPIFLLAN